ncbi:MAG: glucose 1-dehydrogenase [Planctomycetota bacterium]|nr:MAG: glucose 1-dehydrogenase [Planctomycetota bacterium]
MSNLEAFDLTGKTALITGGNTGIGLGIAKGLARSGAKVAIHGRDETKLTQACKEIADMGGEAIAAPFDLEDNESLPAAYAQVSERLGGVDVLVNNAGMQCRGRADQIALNDFNRILKVNLTAPYVLSQCYARERIAEGKEGSLILIASLMSEASRPTTSPYTATKGAIRQLVKAFAVDWADFGIRVNGIGPGYIQTGMTQPLLDKPDFDAWVKQRTPLGRWGQPQDFEGAATFLASNASRFITGQIIYVDGGWLATF